MTALSMRVIMYRHKDWFRKMAAFAAVLVAVTWPLLQIISDLLRYEPSSCGTRLQVSCFYSSYSG